MIGIILFLLILFILHLLNGKKDIFENHVVYDIDFKGDKVCLEYYPFTMGKVCKTYSIESHGDRDTYEGSHCGYDEFTTDIESEIQVCRKHKKCNHNEYILKEGTENSNAICHPLSLCSDHQYELVQSTEKTDKICKELTKCNITEDLYEMISPTNNSVPKNTFSPKTHLQLFKDFVRTFSGLSIPF